LADFLVSSREVRSATVLPKFGDLVAVYKREIENDVSLKPGSKSYRRVCLRKIEMSWPELVSLRLGEISEEACKEWAARLNGTISAHYFNNTVSSLKSVLALGFRNFEQNGGEPVKNPAMALKKVRVKPKELHLPESGQFRLLVDTLRKRGRIRGPRIADMVEFLAYGGMRVRSESVNVKWSDVDWQRKEIVVRGHEKTATKNGEIRRVPILPDMERLLTRLKEKLGAVGVDRILQITRCNRAQARGCNAIGIPKITHHDLRHLFATRCIEAGVDIPTVSRWLGHKDGGALAMRVYGHLRNEHSLAMAQKVKF
jgi:integrase